MSHIFKTFISLRFTCLSCLTCEEVYEIARAALKYNDAAIDGSGRRENRSPPSSQNYGFSINDIFEDYIS